LLAHQAAAIAGELDAIDARPARRFADGFDQVIGLRCEMCGSCRAGGLNQPVRNRDLERFR
jgi:hypothetical protein